MSKKRIPNSKILQVIKNWINGREDELFEVFPTKKENKYIVRERKQPLKEKPVEEPKPIEEEHNFPPPPPSNDINYEILSELRALGQEMKLKREKKEQKKMIKEVMNKELNKRNPVPVSQPIEEEE
ncbi:hypothetical protein M9Y10_038203 [Tritrichomonas musculus]|uniref:Uncharacterized protein n=1 Tax=Tritrichomonas musculus TaxID=1915356 RepID=A0ABR2KAY2_9EUKA